MATAQQSKLLVYLIMVLGVVMGFLYSSGSDPAANVPGLGLEMQATALQSLRDVRIDESVLNSEAFTALRVFGSLPVEPTAGGTTNPFQ